MENEQLYESLKDLLLESSADINTRLENLEAEQKQLKQELPQRKADYYASTGQLRQVKREAMPLPGFDGRPTIDPASELERPFITRMFESPDFVGFMKAGGQGNFQFKATGSLIQKAVGTITLGTMAPVVLQDPALKPMYMLRLRSLLPSVSVSSENILAIQEGASEGDAGIQAGEGQSKPQIDMKFAQQTIKLSTFAAWTKISTQALADLVWLRNVVETYLAYKVRLKEEEQFITDLLAAATDAGAAATGDTIYDVIRKAQGTLQAQGWGIAGQVINPADAVAADLLKTATEKVYIDSPPWMANTITSPKIAAGQALVIAAGAAEILDREASVSVSVGLTNDDFIKNLRVLLAEQRSGLHVRQASGLVKAALPVVTP